MTNEDIIGKAQKWLTPAFDEKTKEKVQELIDSDLDLLQDCFYAPMEFGTGGMRGKMGVGINRINKYTLGMATQGLCSYLKLNFANQKCSVAIAHDTRNKSDQFAVQCAEVFAANDIDVYLFEGPRPTPELSFAVRELGCQAGIVITASHNPPEYNGYKVYWDDGAQIVAPHDQKIIAMVREIATPNEVKWSGGNGQINKLGKTFDEKFLDMSINCLRNRDLDYSKLRVVYTGLHGTGGVLIPGALAKAGFSDVHLVTDQMTLDGNFPTVESPNPEEQAALAMGLDLSATIGADLLMGTDPDADRVGIAARDANGVMQLFNGNDTAAMLVHYQLKTLHASGKLPSNAFIARTIVTSELLDKVAAGFNVPTIHTLTGFKFIADVIRKEEGKREFITGGEESYGYMVGDKVRDKDAVTSALAIAEMAAYVKNQGQTLDQYLEQIHTEYKCFRESLISIKKEGIEGKKAIDNSMTDLRKNPPAKMANSEVVAVSDFQESIKLNLKTGESQVIDLPKSNVLQFELANESIVTARPSGTEPKIKFYFSVREEVEGNYQEVRSQLEDLISQLEKELMALIG